MRSVLVAMTVLVACYHPNAPANAPCGPNDECPAGQTCFAGFCRSGLEVDVGTPADDAPVTAIDAPAQTIDAPTTTTDAPAGACAGGDGTCLVSCVATDPDCVTTCGDGTCVGNANELCGNCTADCATTTPVCGNGACDPGEAPDCYADCGPTPWTWLADEQSMIDQINAKRITGFACPTGPLPAVQPLARHDAFTPTVHEWVWELAHHDVFISGGGACNGRTSADRQLPADFDAYVQSRGYASADAAIVAWFSSDTICPSLMSAVRTKIGVGVAFDVKKGYVAVLE